VTPTVLFTTNFSYVAITITHNACNLIESPSRDIFGFSTGVFIFFSMRPFMAKEMFITSKRHIFMVKRYLLSEQISPDDFAEKSKNVSQVEAFLFC